MVRSCWGLNLLFATWILINGALTNGCFVNLQHLVTSALFWEFHLHICFSSGSRHHLIGREEERGKVMFVWRFGEGDWSMTKVGPTHAMFG
ncbi:hypothetical protein CsSME_00013513 [Camellia sinensis var. sinensis]